MKHVYESEIVKLRNRERRTAKVSSIYMWLKLCSFVAGCVFLYFAYSAGSVYNTVLAILLFMIYAVFLFLDGYCQRNMELDIRKRKACENEISYFNNDFTPFNDGAEYIDPSHEYSYDLDIFGKDSLFNRINRTVTLIGRNRLAYKLTHLYDAKSDIIRVRQAIQELAPLFEWRLCFVSHSYIDKDISSFKAVADKYHKGNRFIFSVFPVIILSLTWLCFILSLCDVMPWALFSLMFFINLSISIFFSRAATVASLNIDSMYKEYYGYTKILEDIMSLEVSSPYLADIKHKLFEGDVNCISSFKKLSRILNLFDQRSSALIYIFLNGTLLFDIFLIRAFVKWNRESYLYIEKWLDCIAEMDALVSMSVYAYNNPSNKYGEITDDNSEYIFRAENIYHPFLQSGKAVGNDFSIKRKNIAIITGANMAGKSTFLRTIGVTYIMACNGMPLCASSFRYSVVTLFSSMRTSDNLSKDISYFNAELIRLKSLADHVKRSDYTLIILDEILKGTNSRDKLNGSVIFLNEISKYNVSALIATHDLELSRLEEENPRLYSNYKFEIELSDEIRYTYKIEHGVAQNLNASYLLSNMLGLGK